MGRSGGALRASSSARVRTDRKQGAESGGAVVSDDVTSTRLRNTPPARRRRRRKPRAKARPRRTSPGHSGSECFSCGWPGRIAARQDRGRCRFRADGSRKVCPNQWCRGSSFQSHGPMRQLACIHDSACPGNLRDRAIPANANRTWFTGEPATRATRLRPPQLIRSHRRGRPACSS